jgi:hypothetical protein
MFQNQNNMFINPFINQMMNNNQFINNNQFNNNIISYQQYQQRLNQMNQQQKIIAETNMLNNFLMMQAFTPNNVMQGATLGNYNNDNNNNNISNDNINNNNNSNQNNASIIFLIVPKNWDGTEDSALRIVPQVSLEDTIETAINNFYIKLQKPREAITEFKFNGTIINVKSKQKLKEFGLENNSKIIAVRADNFDALNNIN